jgi:LacI family transcriptional regulator
MATITSRIIKRHIKRLRLTRFCRMILGHFPVRSPRKPVPKKFKPVRAATLADVGRKAGVSAMAASMVLNGARTTSRISAATRDRISKAAKYLGYRPNATARALATRRMDTVGVVASFEATRATEGDSHYFLELFSGILEAAARYDQNTTVFGLHDWSRDSTRLNEMCDGRIDGLILIGPSFSREAAKLLPTHTPFVALHANCPMPNVVNIECDDERGAQKLVNHLVAQGHRRILHVMGPKGFAGGERRFLGYRRALSDSRIAFDKDLLISGNLTVKSGRDAIRQWLKQHIGDPLPHAIFAVNDNTAAGCLEALSEIGLRVPEDISVVGFDDTLIARTTVPPLTTVRQPLHGMGQQAVEVLLAQIRGMGAPLAGGAIKPIVFPVDLVLRESLGRLPAKRRLVPEL